MPIAFNPAESLLIDDFEAFLRYLESKPAMPLTAAGDLKSADLWALNDRVNYKAPDYVTPRSRQIDYPLLGFLFQVATSSRLFLVQFGKATTLQANRARLDAYHQLTLEERYVFLLETAWCHLDWATLDGDDRSGQGAAWFREGVTQLLKNPIDVPVRVIARSYTKDDAPDTVQAFVSANVYIRMGYWFGWYDVRELPTPSKRDKYSFEFEQITLAEWGRECLTVLHQRRPFHLWNQNAFSLFEPDADATYEEAVAVNVFVEPFRTLLDEPDLVSLYPINPNPPKGTYWLRVELPNHKVSRTIAMPAEETLEGFHEAIQDAFNFDNDHLYIFCLNLRNPYNGPQYYDPRTEPGWADGDPADEATLASLNLYEGQRLLYIFDFGNRWEFFITLERHLPNETTKTTKVIDKVGKAPRQY